MSRPIRLLVPALLGALLAVGCTTATPVIDDAAVESAIEAQIGSQLGMEFTGVDCPSGRPVEAGDVFECTATTAEGSTLTIRATQRDAAGNVDLALTTLVASRIEELIGGQLAQQVGQEVAEIDCGEDRQMEANATFQCSVELADGSTATLNVTQTDDLGNVTWTVAE